MTADADYETYRERVRRALSPGRTVLATLLATAYAVAVDQAAFAVRPEGPALFHYLFRLAGWVLLSLVFFLFVLRLRRHRPRIRPRHLRWPDLRRPVLMIGLGVVVLLQAARMLLRDRVPPSWLMSVQAGLLMLALMPVACYAARRLLAP